MCGSVRDRTSAHRDLPGVLTSGTRHPFRGTPPQGQVASPYAKDRSWTRIVQSSTPALGGRLVEEVHGLAAAGLISAAASARSIQATPVRRLVGCSLAPGALIAALRSSPADAATPMAAGGRPGARRRPVRRRGRRAPPLQALRPTDPPRRTQRRRVLQPRAPHRAPQGQEQGRDRRARAHPNAAWRDGTTRPDTRRVREAHWRAHRTAERRGHRSGRGRRAGAPRGADRAARYRRGRDPRRRGRRRGEGGAHRAGRKGRRRAP
ncbi:hypothetical protein BS35_006118 [Actinomadura glauciflava]|nr:hypothetical protein [Actinomadura glauciflava]